tara:strand:+ start:602 stop:1192 length:591 start_codon:yes stop_codon:yes gene_type:complete
MKTVDKTMKNSVKILKQAGLGIENIMDNKFVLLIIALFIGLYGPRLSPRLPRYVRMLFNNALFRLLVLVLIIFLTNKNLEMALIISICFLLVMNLVNSLDVEEHFVKKFAENYSEYGHVHMEKFEGDSQVDDKSAQASAQTSEQALKNLGQINYEQGYSAGGDSQCPIGSTGGAPYSESPETVPDNEESKESKESE